MNLVETLGLALGAGFSSGLNLYATVATLGLLHVMACCSFRRPCKFFPTVGPWNCYRSYLVEFLADKIRTSTHLETVHTFIRPPAAALLAFAAAGAAPAEWRWGAALCRWWSGLTRTAQKQARAPQRHSAGAAPAGSECQEAAAGGRMNVWTASQMVSKYGILSARNSTR